MEIEQIKKAHHALDEQISKLEEIRGYLSYENVIKLNELKKVKLLIKDKLENFNESVLV